MNEFGLIHTIRKSTRTDTRVRVGIGDDAAVLTTPVGKELLFTTDMLIEGRHFKMNEATPYEVGRKALAVNLSDIAAMGGVPTHAVVAIGLPKKWTRAFVKEIHRGLSDLAKRFHVNIVGGDTNRSDRIILSVALLGEAVKGKAILRSGARVGDRIFVTGPLGGSYLSRKHLLFTPRLAESNWLVKNVPIHAMMDISDGLASDLRHLAEESYVGALIEAERVPIARHAKNLKAALTDGEDFELLFTLSAKDAKRLPKRFVEIGRVVPKKEGVTLLMKNGTKKIMFGGFDHFK